MCLSTHNRTLAHPHKTHPSLLSIIRVYLCSLSSPWKPLFLPLSTVYFLFIPVPSQTTPPHIFSSSFLSLDKCSLVHIIYAKPFMPLEYFSSLNTSHSAPKYVLSKLSVFWYCTQKWKSHKRLSLVWFGNWTNVGNRRKRMGYSRVCVCVCLCE